MPASSVFGHHRTAPKDVSLRTTTLLLEIISTENLGRLSPIWPSGTALTCKQSELGSIPLRLSFLFKTVIYGPVSYTHLTLPTTCGV